MEGGRNDLGFGVRRCNLDFFHFFSFLLSFCFMSGLCMSAGINI